jgi:hypothetical protein
MCIIIIIVVVFVVLQEINMKEYKIYHISVIIYICYVTTFNNEFINIQNTHTHTHTKVYIFWFNMRRDGELRVESTMDTLLLLLYFTDIFFIYIPKKKTKYL